MDLQLTGQTAVVVGGGRGIGRAIAHAFAAEGCAIALLDRDAELHATARALESTFPIRALGILTDVTQYAAVQQAAATVAQTLGRIDHIVFTVAIGTGKYGFPFWNLEPGDWSRVLEVTSRRGQRRSCLLACPGAGALGDDAVPGVGGGADWFADGPAVQCL